MNAIAIGRVQAPRHLSFFEKIFARIEWFRIKNHLRIVEKELRRKNVNHLSFELQQKRAKNLDRLHTYWTNGLYPINRDFADRRVPYFKDAVGTPCAMAYLIEQSGHQDLVNAVTKSNNHVYIDNIYDGPIIEWINKSGLTKTEAARVQPTYGPCGTIDGSCPDQLIVILPWVAASVGFILLEWLSYKIASWITPDSRKRRIMTWLYFTLNNLIIATILWSILYLFIDAFSWMIID
jgi:hypothetical protein